MAQFYRMERSHKAGYTPLGRVTENAPFALGALIGCLIALGTIALLTL